MGKSIDEHKEHLLDIMDSMPDDACGDWRDSLAYAIDTMHKYQMMQADYEARLKADLEAILTEIQLEIEELRAKKHFQYKHGQEHGLNDASEIIQQKINELKAESEVQDV